MHVYFGLDNALYQSSPSAVTIGNFDGVHRGHLKLLYSLKREAEQQKLVSVVMTFEPLPKEFFASRAQKHMPIRINPLADKLAALEHLGMVDRVIIVPFNEALSNISAYDFTKQVLIERLNTRALVIGNDFHFGRDRQGDCGYLSGFSEFKTVHVPAVMEQGQRISSSAVRDALLASDFKQVEVLLGRPYTISGTVKHGLKLGRQLGYPTANINIQQHHFALHGIYIVDVKGCFGKKRGVASFGTNPTISVDPQIKFEVHILDFDQDIYGDMLEVAFQSKIREEAKFTSLSALKEEIAKDIKTAKQWHNHK